MTDANGNTFTDANGNVNANRTVNKGEVFSDSEPLESEPLSDGVRGVDFVENRDFPTFPTFRDKHPISRDRQFTQSVQNHDS